jgi:peroxiredoxin Q/BCP
MMRIAIVAWAVVAVLGCGAAQKPPAVERKLLPVGAEVPALTRVDQRRQVVNLRAGTPTLLYFYPKDGTPGCTQEACALRDKWNDYRVWNIRVIGVSVDTDDEHRAFSEEHKLPFSLIADPEHVWSDALGVGQFQGGLDERVSFLIDADNRIVKVYENVDPGIHADEVLRDAQALGLK